MSSTPTSPKKRTNTKMRPVQKPQVEQIEEVVYEEEESTAQYSEEDLKIDEVTMLRLTNFQLKMDNKHAQVENCRLVIDNKNAEILLHRQEFEHLQRGLNHEVDRYCHENYGESWEEINKNFKIDLSKGSLVPLTAEERLERSRG